MKVELCLLALPDLMLKEYLLARMLRRTKEIYIGPMDSERNIEEVKIERVAKDHDISSILQ